MHEVVWAPRAHKQRAKLSARSRRLADERIRELASGPENVGKKLRGRLQHLRSARLGRHARIVYEIDKAHRTVKIMAIDTRGDVYKRLGG